MYIYLYIQTLTGSLSLSVCLSVSLFPFPYLPPRSLLMYHVSLTAETKPTDLICMKILDVSLWKYRAHLSLSSLWRPSKICIVHSEFFMPSFYVWYFGNPLWALLLLRACRKISLPHSAVRAMINLVLLHRLTYPLSTPCEIPERWQH